MRTDFDRQWERRKAWRSRCPLDDAELRRRVLRAQTLDENSSLITQHSTFNIQHSTFNIRLWLPAAAAACLLAVLLPLGLRGQHTDSGTPEQIDVGGRQCYFACNHGCSAEGTVETFKMTFL